MITANKFPISRLITVFVLLLFTFLMGCIPKSTSESLVKSYAVVAEDGKASQIDNLNEKLFASANLNMDASDYLLGPGDLIVIKVLETKDLDTTVRVTSRGFISLPLLNRVLVKGLTTYQAEEFIESLYRKKYIKDPHISLFLKEQVSQRITLVGQVKNPGTYDHLASQRLLSVLAMAGGLTEKAGTIIRVQRSGSSPETRNVYMIDMDKLIKEGNIELNIPITGGDVIFIPEAGTFFVDGAVRKPGSYALKSKMILQEAILAAGGFAPYAEKDEVTIIRSEGEEGRKIIRLNFEKDPNAQGMAILDRDVIIAKDSGWGKMIHGTGFNIGVPGFLGIGYRDPTQ